LEIITVLGLLEIAERGSYLLPTATVSSRLFVIVRIDQKSLEVTCLVSSFIAIEERIRINFSNASKRNRKSEKQQELPL
jgi:hypothetical protein